MPTQVERFLGPHPPARHPLGRCLTAADRLTQSKRPHRALQEIVKERSRAIKAIREMLTCHHASPEALERSRRRVAALKALGYDSVADREGARRFPTSDTTRKGNLAEVVLAEYVVAASGLDLPVYRLRYNPNVEQSMKGDDVLAFDLDSKPVRILVGEAKFRGTPTTAAVQEIADSLLRSYKAGIPASLQFVADRLYDQGENELAERIEECALLFVQRKLRIDYIGLLLSNTDVERRVHEGTPNALRNLVMLSLSLGNPDQFADACFDGLR